MAVSGGLPPRKAFTGVGRPVFDMFVDSGIHPTGVVITGGMSEAQNGLICSVSKLNLVSRLQALLHEARLKIQRELDEADTLVRELQDFRMEYTAAGHMTFNARSGKHDDLVLALAIAVWRAHDGGTVAEVYLDWLRRWATGSRASEQHYFVGVDLGQSRDPTAIAVVRRIEPPAPVPEDAGRPKRCYAPGSLEWQEEQRRRREKEAEPG